MAASRLSTNFFPRLISHYFSHHQRRRLARRRHRLDKGATKDGMMAKGTNVYIKVLRYPRNWSCVNHRLEDFLRREYIL
jgi:hypothetical protein